MAHAASASELASSVRFLPKADMRSGLGVNANQLPRRRV